MSGKPSLTLFIKSGEKAKRNLQINKSTIISKEFLSCPCPCPCCAAAAADSFLISTFQSNEVRQRVQFKQKRDCGADHCCQWESYHPGEESSPCTFFLTKSFFYALKKVFYLKKNNHKLTKQGPVDRLHAPHSSNRHNASDLSIININQS